MNCADNFNGQICRSNSVAYFPMIKYYPRSAAGFSDSILMEAAHSGPNLRDQLAMKVNLEADLSEGCNQGRGQEGGGIIGKWPDRGVLWFLRNVLRQIKTISSIPIILFLVQGQK